MLLKWNVQRGVAVIPKAGSEPHLAENIEGLFGWRLTWDQKVGPRMCLCVCLGLEEGGKTAAWLASELIMQWLVKAAKGSSSGATRPGRLADGGSWWMGGLCALFAGSFVSCSGHTSERIFKPPPPKPLTHPPCRPSWTPWTRASTL